MIFKIKPLNQLELNSTPLAVTHKINVLTIGRGV